MGGGLQGWKLGGKVAGKNYGGGQGQEVKSLRQIATGNNLKTAYIITTEWD